MNFEIAALESAATATFDVVVGKTDKGEPVGFRVLGSSSEPYAKARRDVEVMAVQASANRKAPLDLTTNEGAAQAVDKGEQAKSAMLNACVVDWFGFTMDGKPAKFSAENLSRVLKVKPDWTDRLVREIENDANFTKG